ncbi:MAG: CoA transferase [Pseudomonadota bacterium]
MATDGPLSGVRVLDLTNVLAGPYCCYQLALFGAEVIKVERAGSGDLARQLGSDPDRNASGMGISFLAQNAGKQSVTLDLKLETDRARFIRLVKTADVLVENFRPGVMDRLGLGYDVLRVDQPELIYCAISGFGQDGPLRDAPAYDQIVQGVSGVMSITGTAEGDPTRVGYPLADTFGGMTAAFAISAALNRRPRGCFLDVSMLDAMLSSMGWVVSNHLIGGTEPVRHGNENTTSAPSGTFRTADDPINIAANQDQQWETLARLLGLADLMAEPAYRTREDRKRNRLALRDELETVLAQRPAAHWVETLSAAGVPCGPVLNVPAALDQPQVRGRDLIASVEVAGGPVDVCASPVLIDGRRPHPNSAPPVLGQDSDRLDALCERGAEGGTQ